MENLSDNERLLNNLFKKHAISTGLSILGAQACFVINSILAGKFFGGEGLAIMSIVSPIYSIYAAIGALCGIGGSIITAHAIGRNDSNEANETFSCALIFCVGISAVFSIFALTFSENFLYLLGANENNLPIALHYATIFILGGVFIALFYIPYHFLKLTGQLKFLITLFVGMAVENFVLDIIFCTLLGLGIESIALGTILSALITVVIGLYILRKDFKFLRVKNFETVRQLFRFGSPSALNQISNFVRFVLLNHLLLFVGGQVGLIVFSVVKVIENLSTIILAGISQATSAFVGVFFTERDNTSIRQIEQYAHKVCFELILILVVGVWIFAPEIANLFGVVEETPAHIQVVDGVRIFSISLLPSVLCMILTSYYQSTKFTKLANIITSFRGFIFLLIPAYFLAPRFGMNMIWWSFTISAFVALIMSQITLHLDRKENQSRILLLDLKAESEGKYISFTVKAETDSIVNGVKNVADFCKKNNLTVQETMLVRLAIEEMLIAIKDHAFGDNPTETMDIRIFVDTATIVLRIRTGGRLFNPLAYYKSMEEKNLMEFAMTDALGIAMINKVAREVHYQSTFGINNLTIVIDRKEVLG